MGRPARFLFPAMDRDGICAAQTLGAAGSLTINGALLDLPATQNGVFRAVQPGIRRVLSIYSAADLSAVLFTISGYGLLTNNALSESILGPSAGATVFTSTNFSTVTSIVTNAAVGTAVEIGTGPSGFTNWYTIDQFQDPTQLSYFGKISGSAEVNVEYTPDNVNSDTSPMIIRASDDSFTADFHGKLDETASFMRAAIVAMSGDGAFEFTISQAG